MDIQEFLSNPKTAYYAKEYARLQDELTGLDSLQQEGMGKLVEEERAQLQEQMEQIKTEMEAIVKAEVKEEKIPNEIVLEVRAGVGGDEAAIFARNLAEMYEGYAAQKGFEFLPIDISKNNVDGYKEASFQVRGKEVYKFFQYEMGVHRIQRVPVTEKSGRVHTSTASVAILPIRKQKTFSLDEKDLKFEFSRSGGAGGQNVNKVETAVRVIHMPSGLEVRCTQERSQLKNREKAISILEAKVAEEKQKKEDSQYGSLRKDQIGTQSRSEKIRTYNILQDRVTDHRAKKSWSNIEGILAGNIEKIIKDLSEYFAAPIMDA